MKRITIDARMINNSGIGTYIRNIVPRIISQLKDCHFVVLGNVKILEAYDWTHNERVTLRSCNAKIYSLKEQISVLWEIDKENNLFWAPHYVIPVLYRGKILVTIHDVFHLAMPQYAKGFLKQWYAKGMFWCVRKKASTLMTVSQFAKSEILKYTGQGNQKIEVIYHGIDQSWFTLPKLKSPYSKPYILFIGNVKPHKNLINLLKAFDIIKNNISQDVVIIGQKDGLISPDNQVEGFAEKFGNRIHFTGQMDYEDTTFRQFFVHADVLILPSFYETFGLPALEAMACGCPVIVSHIAALPEIYGDTAIYCDPFDPKDIANKILMVINNPELRTDLKQKGLEKAKEYSWDKCAKETVKVINNLINNLK